MNVPDLLNFLRRCIDKDHIQEKLKHLKLYHCKGAVNRQVDEWAIPDPANVEAVCKTVSETASIDARGIGGIHKYVLLAFFGDAQDPSRTHPFTVHAIRSGGTGEMSGLDTVEEATIEGQHGMLMRHQEAMARLYFPEHRNALEDARNENIRLQTRISELEEKVDGFNEIRERLANEDHKRALELRKTLFHEHLKEQALEFAMPMLPMALNHMVGSKVLPENTTPRDQMVRAFVATLTPDQLPALQKALKPQQAALMMQIAASYQAEHEQMKAKMEEKGAPVMDHKDIGVTTVSSALIGRHPGIPSSRNADVKVNQSSNGKQTVP